GVMLMSIICSSDINCLTNFPEGKKARPIYMTIGNILSSTWNKPLKLATDLLAHLPI
ncbi:hypothetical protein HOY80DRAFT_863538, partial [Tuber brumale]